MWVSNEVKLGNTTDATYSLEDWEKVYASIKVNVEGDFLEKTVESPMLPENGAGVIMSKLGTDGLVAINNDGRLYTGEGVIREYRYSGPVVNNYIIFNDDGDSETEANELWRIVGVFKNSEGKWNLKLMRDTTLTSEEMPNNYVVNGTSYQIEYLTTGNAYWNNPSTTPTTTYSDWTRAGLQYFLNTESDDNGTPGYFATFTENAKELIDRNYTYYLGNNYYADDSVNGDTAISSYKNERNAIMCPSGITENSYNANCNIWYGNQAMWKGAVGLLYPSDYGYSASNANWKILLWNYSLGAMNTSWMQTTANHSNAEWLLNPSSGGASGVSSWGDDGYVYWSGAIDLGVRGVLNLKSETTIEGNHEGSKSDPYRVIER